MATYIGREGDIISLDNPKAGALTMSVPLYDYPGDYDPATLWETQPAVRTVTGAIARNVSGIPLHVYRRVSDVDRERVTDTPVARLMKSPAPGIGAARFWEQVVLDLAVHDRWACLVGYDETHGGLVLTRLPAHRVAVAIDGGHRAGVILFGDRDEYHIPNGRVVYDVAPSAMPGLERDRGSSRLRTLTTLTDELDAAGEWRRQVLANGARVPAVIERPVEAPRWDDTSWNRFRASWAGYRSGGGSEGGTPILEDGMKLARVDVFNPRDFDTEAIRRLTLIEAAILYHYPPELLGAREGTYSNVEAFREQLYVDVLGPWVTNLEQALNVGLSSYLDPLDYIEANVDAKLRGAFEDRARIFQTSVGAPIMTRNEARARMNLPAVDGGDELVTPLNVIVGGLASPTDTAPPLPKGRRRGRKADRPSGLGDVEVERERFVVAATKHWHERADRLMTRLDLKALPDVASVWDVDDEAAALSPIMRRHMQRLAEVGAWDVLDEWNPDADGWGPEMVEAWIAKAAETNARTWCTSVRDGLAEAIASDDPAGRLASFLTSDGLLVAEVVAFAAEAVGFGGNDAARKSGLSRKRWVVNSGNPRASHAAMDGETVPIDDVFSNGLRWPGDSAGGDASERANCLCGVEFIYDD